MTLRGHRGIILSLAGARTRAHFRRVFDLRLRLSSECHAGSCISERNSRLSPLSLFGSSVDRSALALTREQEALVAALGNLGAFPAVSAEAFRTEIRQEAARLAGDIGAHVPGIR